MHELTGGCLDDCHILFPLPGDCALVLGLSSSLSLVTLDLAHPSAPEFIELGWDDQAHWHPHVLRWKELEAICRCLAVRDPRLVHPGLPFLLLYRFAQVDADDDPNMVRTALANGWRSLGLFSEGEISQAVERTQWHVIPTQVDRRWLWNMEYGWVNTGEEAYSLRFAENERFPFSVFNTFLVEVERCVARHPK